MKQVIKRNIFVALGAVIFYAILMALGSGESRTGGESWTSPALAWFVTAVGIGYLTIDHFWEETWNRADSISLLVFLLVGAVITSLDGGIAYAGGNYHEGYSEYNLRIGLSGTSAASLTGFILGLCAKPFARPHRRSPSS